MRHLLSPLARGATGNKILVINSVVAIAGSGTANFFNTMAMRYTEIDKGISVYKDEQLTEQIGISKKCAEKAVINTASSRVVMSILALAIPPTIMLTLRSVGLSPVARGPKLAFESGTIGVGLFFGLPMSVACFPSICKTSGAGLEKPFKEYSDVYYNRGM